jgi:hypothetical protein
MQWCSPCKTYQSMIHRMLKRAAPEHLQKSCSMPNLSFHSCVLGSTAISTKLDRLAELGPVRTETHTPSTAKMIYF